MLADTVGRQPSYTSRELVVIRHVKTTGIRFVPDNLSNLRMAIS